jgi:Fe-S-cluster containining protein
MIQIGDIIVSRDLFDSHFICNLRKCEGNCCVYGDSGAPLEDHETELLEKHQKQIGPFMRAGGRRALREQGSWVIDPDGDKVTPLVEGEECAFVYFDEAIARCAIERAFEAEAISFQKPLSCHLYPIRITRLKTGVALNYHRWSICESARSLGLEQGVPVFRFLKGALIRAFGSDFYDELEHVYSEM